MGSAQQRFNRERKRRARKVLDAYHLGEPQRQNAVDLLTDMLHLYGEKAFEQLLRVASGHYREEKANE